MRVRLTILTAVLAIVTAGNPILAHHSIARTYDASKPATLKGVITKVEWMNPHAWISMDVKNANGLIASWRVEIAAPNALYRDGIRREFFELSKSYTMEIWPALDGSKTAAGRTLTFPDGQTFDVSDKFFSLVTPIK